MIITFLRNRAIILVFLILLAGFFLRIFHFQELFYFAIDEEKAAYIIQGITSGKHFPTVGHPSSIGFRLGPLLYYLIALFYKIFGSRPIVFGYLSIIASLFSMILIYHLGSKFNRITGIFALILYSFSYLNILYDRRGWQLSFHSLLALGILFSLLKLKNGQQNYLFLLTILLIAASQFEVATLLFLPLVIIIWFILKIKVKKQLIAISIFIFLLSQISLLIFDFRHNFLNTKYLLNYFNPTAKQRINPNIPLTGIRSVYLAHNLIPSSLTRTLFNFSPSNVAIQYANCPQYLFYKQENIPTMVKIIPIILLLLFLIYTLKNWNNITDKSTLSKIIATYLILLFSGISIYTYIFNGEMAEYYLLSSFAYFFIMVGFFASRVYQTKFKVIIILLLFIFMIDNSNRLINSYNPYGYKKKIEVINYSLSKIGDESFVLESFQTCWYSGGYRYLYTLSRKEPLRSYMDQYLSEYYLPDETRKPQYQIVILTPELIGNNPTGYENFVRTVKTESEGNKKIGIIEVYVNRL